jgi:hypothetical protein
VKMPRRFAVAVGLAGVIAIVATLPMFGVWRAGIGFVVLALPGMIAISAMAGDVHTHVATMTLFATWIIYSAAFLVVVKIWSLFRAK